MFNDTPLKSVSVEFVLEWTFNLNINVVSLFLAQGGQLSVQGRQMKSGNLLIKFLWKFVNFSLLVFGGIFVLPEIDLGKSLVGEGA